MKAFKVIAFLLLVSGILSCTADKPETNIIQHEIIKPEEAEEVKVNASFIRIDRELSAITSREDMERILLKYPAFFKQYLKGIAAKPKPADVDRMFEYYSVPQLKAFGKEVEKSWGNMEPYQNDLNEMFRFMKYYLKDFKEPEIYTIYSGLMEPDMAFSDTAIVVCLDWFLGPKASYRPNLYEYMLSRYDKPYMMPMVALGISTKFNKQNKSDETLLATMIYYGKSHYFVERVLPDLPDSLNIGYTTREINGIDANLNRIWGHFIDNKVLFETNHKIVDQYTGEGPFVNEISEDCPGRIGRWLGWQIVRKYMNEHPEVSLQELMDEQDAGKIFKLSGYKPPMQKQP